MQNEAIKAEPAGAGELLLGIDLGGTQVRAGLVRDGRILKLESAPVAGLQTEREVLDRIFLLLDDLGPDGVAGIGVGVPSIVDVQRGIVYDTVNIPSWKEVYLKDILQERYGIPVQVNNDANCFALCEQRYGAGAGCDTLVGMTIGTGLGTGIVIGGRLFNGMRCGAGEIGNIGYLDATIEAYASGQFFRRHHSQTGEELLRLAAAGSAAAQSIFDQFGRHLGHAMLMAVYAYDPGVIVLGGSVTASYPFFKQGMEETLKTCVFPHTLESLHIVCSRTRDAGVIGAACLAG